jgi:hypothetical protein
MNKLLLIDEKFLEKDECESIINHYKFNNSFDPKHINERIKKAISDNFSTDFNGFFLDGPFDVQFDEYKKNKGYVDFKSDNNKLNYITFVIQLNDDYEKGYLQFTYKEETEHIQIQRELGLLIVHFSSLKHRKIPVSKGTKYTLTGFFRLKKKEEAKQNLI